MFEYSHLFAVAQCVRNEINVKLLATFNLSTNRIQFHMGDFIRCKSHTHTLVQKSIKLKFRLNRNNNSNNHTHGDDWNKTMSKHIFIPRMIRL